jgi:hypothetical protein
VVLKFIKYYVTASNGRGHGIHSPFVFDFVKKVMNDSRHFYAFDPIEQIRKSLLVNNKLLTIEDFGAGSQLLKAMKER